MSAATPVPVEITVSRHFLGWLDQERIGLAFTTYQTNRLFLIGLNPDGALSTFERLFDRPMGLWADGQRLHMTTRAQLWQLDNALPAGQTYDEYDRLYVPRRAFTTGDADAHDLSPDAQGRLVFVNTLFSCLATASERYSFSVLWQPSFISALVPEDRCHLNGLAMQDGEPRYVTAVSRSDTAAGWRDRREAGGVLVDVRSNEILLDTLSMPHSPRLFQGRVWLLDSGTGELGWADLDRRAFTPVAFCPGYLRGLAFHGDYAIVGLSKPRRNRAFQGLTLDDRLHSKDSDARCGLWIVDTRTGGVAHWLQIEGLVEELYDVAVLPSVRRPMALGFKTDEINRLVTIEHGDRAIFQVLTDVETHTAVQETLFQPSSERASLGSPQGAGKRRGRVYSITTEERPNSTAYRYQLSVDVTLAQAVRYFDGLTFPRLSQEARFKPPHEPMTAVLASLDGESVGLALAERRPENDGALVRSLFVAPTHRRRGVGGGLLRALAKGLYAQGCPHVDIAYRTDWPSQSAIEGLLQLGKWLPPRVHLYRYTGTPERVLAIPSFAEATLPGGFSFFSWSELTQADRQAIQERQAGGGWYPAVLDPFQLKGYLEPSNSVGLRFEGHVAGWMVTHRRGPETVQYTCLFVAPEFRSVGRGKLALALIAEALRCQRDAGIPCWLFQVEADNRAMLRFTRQYLGPCLTVSELRVARKLLSSASA